MDEFQIEQTINCYHEAASLADWDRAVSTFMPDGIWEIIRSGKVFKGYSAIREAFETFTAPLDYVVQVNAPGSIVVDGDTATARSAIRETGKFSGRDEALEAFGIYSDRLARTNDGWRFAYRAFDLRWMHRVPILSN